MIPSRDSQFAPRKQFAPWLNATEGDTVEILTEFKSSDSEKLKGKLVADVSFGGKTYAVSMSNLAYVGISRVFGVDTKDWIGHAIQYEGKKKFKTQKFSGSFHSWIPIETEINLDEHKPF